MRCPLCSETSALAVVSETPYERIWTALAEETRGDYTSDVRAKNTPDPHATLVRCQTCDLDFFWPVSPGDESFYAALISGDYFKDDLKWEFGWTLDQLMAPSADINARWCAVGTPQVDARGNATASVLDVGCGRGDFLTLAQARGHQPFGVETDATAAASARAKGIAIDERRIEKFSLEKKDSFDVVTSFHVLEHVSDPLEFARCMRACAKPDGRVVISVPNRERTYLPEKWGEIEPLEFPPHHVTRWSERALRELAHLAGMRVEIVQIEPLPWAFARHSLEKKIQARAKERLGAAGLPLGAVAGFLASRAAFPSSRLYERLGIGERAGLAGLAIVVVMRKQGAS